MSLKKSEIIITVEVDKNKVPEKLSWSAKDANIIDNKSKAMFLSVWDHINKESLRIDLWTKDMPVEEMKHFFYQMFLSMADSYLKATNDNEMTNTMKDFCDYFKKNLAVKQ